VSQSEKTPKEKLFEEIKQIVDKYVIETKVG
jgi:hypothetical protein